MREASSCPAHGTSALCSVSSGYLPVAIYYATCWQLDRLRCQETGPRQSRALRRRASRSSCDGHDVMPGMRLKHTRRGFSRIDCTITHAGVAPFRT